MVKLTEKDADFIAQIIREQMAENAETYEQMKEAMPDEAEADGMKRYLDKKAEDMQRAVRLLMNGSNE